MAVASPPGPAPKPHHGQDGSFRNPWPGATLRGFSALARWMLQRCFRRVRGTLPADPPAASFPLERPDLVRPRAGADACRVTWLGHATSLLQVGALNVLTDPVWSARASPLSRLGPRRVVPPPLALTELPPLDLVLVSHNHYDHFDTATIRALVHAHPAARWLAPLGLATPLRRLGVGQVVELDWWDRCELATPGGLAAVRATPAQHFSGRSPFDRNATLWCGFALEAGTPVRRVFFAGDSGLHPEFARIGELCGPFDVTLLPIGLYEPQWFMRTVHMNPEEAVEAFVAVSGGGRCLLVPIHWGTFKLTDEALDEPSRRLAAEWGRRALPFERLRILRHGATAIAQA